MAVSLETIRKITIVGSAQGIDPAAASLNKLAAAQEAVAKASAATATVTDMSSKRQLSAAEAYKRQTLAVDEGARMLDRYQKAARVADDSLRQGVITATEHAKRIDLLKDKYGQAGTVATAFQNSLSGVSGQLIALSAGAGPFGVFLSSLGPWGVAAAVGIGAVSAAISEVRDIAASAGTKARDLQELAEATRLSVDQLRGLKKIANEFGAGDKIETWLQRASISTERAALGSGELVEALNKISPVFQRQMEATTNFAERLDVLSAAAKSAKDQGKDVALFWKDVFGARASGRADPVFAAVELAGGVTKVGEAIKNYAGTTKEDIEQRAALSRILEVLQKQYDSMKATLVGSASVLELEIKLQELKNAELSKLLTVQSAVLLSQRDKIALYGDEKRAIDEVREAEEAREAGAARLGGRRGRQASGYNVDRDMGLQEGGTPAGAITAVPATVTPAIAAVTEKVKDYAKEAEIAYNRTKLWMDALGAGATIQETAKLALEKLTMEFLNNKHGLEDATEAQRLYNRAKTEIEAGRDAQLLSLRVGQLGDLASVTDIVRQKEDAIQKARRDGAQFSAKEIADMRTRNQLLAESSKLDNQLKFEREQLFKSQVDQSTDAKLRAQGIPLESDFANAMRNYARMTAAISDIKSAGEEFSKTFVNGLMQGKSAVESMVGAFDQLATKMADKAIIDLFSGQYLQAAVEATVAAVAALSSAFLKSSEAQRKAAENLRAANAAAQQMSSQIGGAGSGSIVQHMTDVNLQTMQILQSFHGAITSASIQLNNDLQAFFQRTVKDFLAGWQGALDQLGDTSVFGQARSNVASLAKTILDFVNNTRDLGTTQQVQTAQTAGRSTLLAMLSAPKALSDTANELDRVHGTAIGLQAALVTLGTSADDAAKAITDGVAAAIDDLSTSFTAGLTARLNAAGGRSFVNDFITLFAQHSQDLADSAALGIGAGLADSVFAAEAQKLVEDNKLIGASFTALTNQFPNLIGVVHEATGAIEDQAAAQDRLNSGASSVVDFLNQLVAGPSSTLSPSAKLANAQSIYNANLGLAQGGNIDAVNKFPKAADDLLKAAQAMFGSSGQYQAIRSQIISQGLGLPAVQATTDPVVIAVRDAIAAIQATTTAVGGTTTAVGTVNTTTGIVASNTGSTASSLGSIAQNTNAIATNTGSIGTISAQTGTVIANTGNSAAILSANLPGISTFTAHTSNATQVAQSLQTQFLPPIYQNTGATAQNTGSIGNISINTGAAANLLNSTNNSGIGAVVINTGNAAQYIGSNDNEGTRGILTLLTRQLTSSQTSFQYSTGTTGVQSGTLFNNNVIDALNKIVWNTFAIATNTFTLAQWTSINTSGGSRLTGTYAQGGTIQPYHTGLVSEHLNPTLLRAGSDPIDVFPGSAANDNSGVISQLQSLRKESSDQNFKLAQLINMLCNLTGKSQQEIVGAIAGLEETTKSEARQDRNNPRWKMTG